MKLTLPIKPFSRGNLEHNRVAITLQYDKFRKGPMLFLQTMRIDHLGFETFEVLGSPHSHLILEQGWKTNNKKRLDAAWDMVQHQLTTKTGDVWDAVVKLLTDAGSEVLDPAPAS